MNSIDPEVAECAARHPEATIPKCSDCQICQDCDVTVEADESGDIRCETCLDAHEKKRLEQLLTWPYGAAVYTAV